MIGTEIQFGVIQPGNLYTLDAFKRRLSISNATLRAARRAGLPVYRLHKRAFIYGKDWIDYVLQSRRVGVETDAS